MKKLLSVAILAIMAIATPISSQAKIFNWGIKGGLNVNKLSFGKNSLSDVTKADNSAGWELGLMAEVNVPVIGLCFDASVMYARMNNGTQAYYSDGAGSVPFNGDNAGKNFMMIPINLKYKLSLPAISNIVKPYAFTGPNFAFKLDKNIANYIKTRTCQVAWNVGLGVELINHLQIGAAYNFGINNIAEHLGANTPDVKVKNNYWTVTAAWLF